MNEVAPQSCGVASHESTISDENPDNELSEYTADTSRSVGLASQSVYCFS